MTVSNQIAATDALFLAYLEQSLCEAEDSTLSSIIEDLFPPADSDSEYSSDSDSSGSSCSEPGFSTDSILPPLSSNLAESILELHSKRYLNERIPIRKNGSLLQMTLNEWRHNRPEIFRRNLRLNPDTFDALVDSIKDNPVFHNNSNNSQFPVSEQVAVALYRLGHYGNAASIHDIALWAGWGVGTVHYATRRFLVAVCRPSFLQPAVAWPNQADQEVARQWVESQTCARWRNGWLMVDGTLVILEQRPRCYGNTYFDRKSNYSLNVQASVHVYDVFYI
jgi:hypothetical protein